MEEMSRGSRYRIAVPQKISDLAEEGWAVPLLLGRTRGGWRVLEAGDVYPY
jgi:hypothetical protein